MMLRSALFLCLSHLASSAADPVARPPPSKSQHFLTVYVFSKPGNMAQRAALRDTWFGEALQARKATPHRWTISFVVELSGSGRADRKLELEASEHGDMIICPQEICSGGNHTGAQKLMFCLEHAHNSFKFQYFVKAEDSTAIHHVQSLLNLIANPDRESKNIRKKELLWGAMAKGEELNVVRKVSSEDYVDLSEWSADEHVPFVDRSLYMVSQDLVEKIAKRKAKLEALPEDREHNLPKMSGWWRAIEGQMRKKARERDNTHTVLLQRLTVETPFPGVGHDSTSLSFWLLAHFGVHPSDSRGLIQRFADPHREKFQCDPRVPNVMVARVNPGEMRALWHYAHKEMDLCDPDTGVLRLGPTRLREIGIAVKTDGKGAAIDQNSVVHDAESAHEASDCAEAVLDGDESLGRRCSERELSYLRSFVSEPIEEVELAIARLNKLRATKMKHKLRRWVLTRLDLLEALQIVQQEQAADEGLQGGEGVADAPVTELRRNLATLADEGSEDGGSGGGASGSRGGRQVSAATTGVSAESGVGDDGNGERGVCTTGGGDGTGHCGSGGDEDKGVGEVGGGSGTDRTFTQPGVYAADHGYTGGAGVSYSTSI